MVVVPNADHTSTSEDSTHLPHRCKRILKMLEKSVGECGVEAAIGERETVGIGDAELDVGDSQGAALTGSQRKLLRLPVNSDCDPWTD